MPKGHYGGKTLAIVWHRFGTDKENEDATGVKIADLAVKLQLMGNHAPSNLARIRTLTVATVSYFAQANEEQVALEFDTMLKKVIAMEPTANLESWPDDPIMKKPDAEHQ
jgi:hypothetical protein